MSQRWGLEERHAQPNFTGTGVRGPPSSLRQLCTRQALENSPLRGWGCTCRRRRKSRRTGESACSKSSPFLFQHWGWQVSLCSRQLPAGWRPQPHPEAPTLSMGGLSSLLIISAWCNACEQALGYSGEVASWDVLTPTLESLGLRPSSTSVPSFLLKVAVLAPVLGSLAPMWMIFLSV